MFHIRYLRDRDFDDAAPIYRQKSRPHIDTFLGDNPRKLTPPKALILIQLEMQVASEGKSIEIPAKKEDRAQILDRFTGDRDSNIKRFKWL